jgi:sugar lactone lactonase YvrE
MARKTETVLGGLAFPEGPRWHDGRLWFSDMHVGEVVAMRPDGARETVLKLSDTHVSGLGWLPDGRLLVVAMQKQALLRREADGSVVTHADLSGIATGLCNDMVVDATGRAYVGNFGFELHVASPQMRPAKLALAHPDGRVEVAAEEMMFPNGTVITPDGRTLIVGESFARRLSAFDIGEDGRLSNRRVWAELPDGALPDGICLDAEGAVWSASPSTSEVVRQKEGGEVLDRVATDQGAYACMLGGEDRRTLYVLTAGGTDPATSNDPRTGRIEQVRVDAPGAGWP